MADTRRAAREWAGSLDATPRKALFLVGVSGGGDSVALAWALSLEAAALDVSVGAVIVDHQLQAGSAQVAARAAAQMEALGLSPVLVKTVSVEGTSNMEDNARKARYQAFTEAVRETGAVGVALAHTLDDQAETVLLGLARGSGPSGLKGMADRDGLYHRPFLGLTRETLRQALRDAGIEWWDDPHNDDESFARVSVRKNVIPVLEKVLGPGVTEALARTAELFREDSATLDSQAEEWFQRHVTQRGGECSVAVNDLAELGSALQTRVLRAMVVAAGGHAPTYVHTKQMHKLLREWRGQSRLNLSGASVERKDGRIIATAGK
ncbi:MAG: hypothetical protein RL247_268 [Actinomycetota bacterium]